MKKVVGAALIAACIVTFPGCETKQDTGVVIGGIAGGLLGSRFGHGGGQVAATMIGAVAGAAIGGAIGNSMDKTDRALAMQAISNNQERSWRNERGNQYRVIPKAANRTPKGYCREYQMEAVIAGKPQHTYGTACRQPDGSWKVVS